MIDLKKRLAWGQEFEKGSVPVLKEYEDYKNNRSSDKMLTDSIDSERWFEYIKWLEDKAANKKLVCGVGIKDAPISFIVDGVRKSCPYYRRWYYLLDRCYSERQLSLKDSYRDCTVCDEWLTLSKFKSWMMTQDWEGKELDKDILISGNRVYSPETCVFVPRRVNLFIMERRRSRTNKDLPIGVMNFEGKYLAQCSRIDKIGVGDYLGCFNTPEEAHEAWRAEKLRIVEVLKDEVDERVYTALRLRYENYKDDRLNANV